MSVQSRVWFNEDLESRNFIIPGAGRRHHGAGGRAAHLADHLARMGARDHGASDLHAGHTERSDVRQARSLSAAGWIDAAFCLIIAALWFEVPFRGTLATLFVTTTLFLTVDLSIGYLLSVLIRSQIGASQIALLVTMLPTDAALRLRFPDRPDAAIHPGRHLSGLFTILCHYRQIDISQGFRLFWRY